MITHLLIIGVLCTLSIYPIHTPVVPDHELTTISTLIDELLETLVESPNKEAHSYNGVIEKVTALVELLRPDVSDEQIEKWRKKLHALHDKARVHRLMTECRAYKGSSLLSTSTAAYRALQVLLTGTVRGISSVDLQLMLTNLEAGASGAYAVIAGGSDNQASADYSTIIAGHENNAAAAYAVLSGQHGVALGMNSFVSTDGQLTTFTITSPNNFAVRAADGITLQGTGPNSITLLVSSTMAESYELILPDTQGHPQSFLTTDGNNPSTLSWQLDPLATATAADIPLTLVLRDTVGSFAATTVTVTGYLQLTDQQNEIAALVGADSQALMILPQAGRSLQTSTSGAVRGNFAVDLQMVLGDRTQVASGQQAVTIGGGYNTAYGLDAVTLAGRNNIAFGINGIACGQQACALYDNSFVFADSQIPPFNAQNPDTFNIRAQGGLVLSTAGPGAFTLALPSTLAAAYSITLPPTVGTPGQVLTTNGQQHAALSWATSSTEALIATGTSANIPLTLVERDSTGSFAATQVTFNQTLLQTLGNSSIGLEAPSVVTAYTLSLPENSGNAGNVLATDGMNPDQLYWTPLSGLVTATIELYGDLVGSSTANRLQTVCGVSSCTLLSYMGTGTSVDIPLTTVRRDAVGSFAATTITATGMLSLQDPQGNSAGAVSGTTTEGISALIIAPAGQRALQLGSITTQSYGLILGGTGNNVIGQQSAIITGSYNNVTGFSSNIIAGSQNSTAGDVSGIAAGQQNTIWGSHSFIGAGILHTTTSSATAIGAGLENIVTATAAFIGAGQHNRASGLYSAVVAGQNNSAAGMNSIALGTHAYARYDNSFVWADSQVTTCTSPSTNSFTIRAANGLIMAGGSGQVTFITPVTGAASYTLELPLNVGPAGYAIQTDGNNPAVLSWASPIATATSVDIPNRVALRDATGSFAATTITATSCIQLLDGIGETAGLICGTTDSLIIAPQLTSGLWVRALQAQSAGNPRGHNSVDLQTALINSNQVASGNNSALLGGGYNIVYGNYGAVFSGQNNNSYGNYSVALGQQALARYDGSFAWADGQIFPLITTTPQSFTIRAAQGVALQGSGPAPVTLFGPVSGLNYSLNLPKSTGSTGQFLTTDGNNPAQLSWTAGLVATATSTDIPNTLVMRDETGNYYATTLTATGCFVLDDVTTRTAATICGSLSGLIISPHTGRALQLTANGAGRGANAVDLQLVVTTLVAQGTNSAIAGGINNGAFGQNSAIFGGQNNVTTGLNALALGAQSYAGYDNSFVWADGQSTTFNAAMAHTFNIRAQNGLTLQGQTPGGVTLIAPNTIYSMILPTTSGLAGQILATSGGATAQLSWIPTQTALESAYTLVLRDSTGSFAATTMTVSGVSFTPGSISLQAPAIVPTAYTLELPQTMSSAGQVLASQGTDPDQLYWTTIFASVTGTLQLYGDLAGTATATSLETVCGMSACQLVTSQVTGTSYNIPDTVVKRDNIGSFTATNLTLSGTFNSADQTGGLGAILATSTATAIFAPQAGLPFQLSAAGNQRGNYAVDLQLNSAGGLASGLNSCVIGDGNTASGNYSFAAGSANNAQGVASFNAANYYNSTVTTALGDASVLISNNPQNYTFGYASFVVGAYYVTGSSPAAFLANIGSTLVATGTGHALIEASQGTVSGSYNGVIGTSGDTIFQCNNSFFAGIYAANTGYSYGSQSSIIGSSADGMIGSAGSSTGENSAMISSFYNTLINVNSGSNSIACAGYNMAITGTCSFASGVNATAAHDYTFVWSGQTNLAGSIYTSTGAHSFNVYAPGGAEFATSINSSGVIVNGVTLPAGGGAWVNMSDKYMKENYQPVDSQDVVRKLMRLPVESWSYKAQGDAYRHIGPYAHDFNQAFEVGASCPQGISTIDARGVKLAAIQGLYHLHTSDFERLKESLRRLRMRIERLSNGS